MICPPINELCPGTERLLPPPLVPIDDESLADIRRMLERHHVPAFYVGASEPQRQRPGAKPSPSVRRPLAVLGSQATSSYQRELDFWEGLPQAFKDRTADAGLIKLQAFTEPNSPAFDWSKLSSAREVAYLKLLREGRSLDSVGYLAPRQVAAVDREELARSAGLAAGRASRIEVFPVAVDGQAVAMIPNVEEGTDWIVGGEVVPEVPPGVLPAIGDAVPPLVAIETPGTGVADDPSPLMKFGDPVGSTDPNDLPRNENEPRLEDARDPNQRGEACGSAGDQLDCYLPTVALHDRWRTYCSGALISSRWVLTAAHCLCASQATHITVGNETPTGLGRRSSASVSVSLGNRVEFFHDGFCAAFESAPESTETFALGDLALVQLTNALLPGDADPFATIGQLSQARDSRVLEIAGFGAREDDRWGGEKYVSGIAVSSATCEADGEDQRQDSDRFGCVAGRELVAIDRELRSDSCHGDSGAPAYARLEDGGMVLIALVSRGLSRECGPGGIYALVVTDAVRTWIRSHASTARLSEDAAALAADFSRKAL